MQNTVKKFEEVINIIRYEVKTTFYERIFKEVVLKMKATTKEQENIYNNYIRSESLFNKIISIMLSYDFEMTNNSAFSDIKVLKAITRTCVINAFGESNFKPIEPYINRLNVMEQIKSKEIYKTIVDDLIVQIEKKLIL